jgi:hypothetical protein
MRTENKQVQPGLRKLVQYVLQEHRPSPGVACMLTATIVLRDAGLRSLWLSADCLRSFHA